MKKLGNKLAKITTYGKIGKNLSRHSFQGEPEIDQVHEIRHQCDAVHNIKVRIDQSLVNSIVSESERNAEQYDNRKIDDENRRNIEPESNKKKPQNLAESQR